MPHRFVVAGAAPSFDGQRLLADTQKICETAIRFWHGQGKAPFTSYLFMLNAVNDGYGGLEHRNSTALICGRRDLPRQGEARQSEGYTTLLGLISHEYFHTWNVKRLRPAEFAGYDYDQENHTAAAVVLRGLYQLLRRPAAAPRGPDRRRHLPQAHHQDHQPGAANAGPPGANAWHKPALMPG